MESSVAEHRLATLTRLEADAARLLAELREFGAASWWAAERHADLCHYAIGHAVISARSAVGRAVASAATLDRERLDELTRRAEEGERLDSVLGVKNRQMGVLEVPAS